MEQFEKQKFIAPEVKQVSERTYQQYLSKLHIPERMLENRGIIVDIGAGFAEFVQKVNERFGNTGTKAYAVDPVYTFFDGNFEKFEQSLEGSGLFLEFGYGRTSEKEKGLEEIKQDMKRLYDEFYKEATQSGSYIAGSHQKLPFQDESVDLVVGNNSILRFHDRKIVIRALHEIIRILKQDGEARIGPTYFNWDAEQNELTLIKYGIAVMPHEIKEQQKTGKAIDEVMFGAFKDLEWFDGIKFYAGIDRDDETDQKVVQNLVFRKDGTISEMTTDDPYFYELRKINFSESEDHFLIPSEAIYGRKDKK